MTNLHEILKQKFPEAILDLHNQFGDETVILAPASLLEIAKFLKEDPEFDMNMLMDMAGVDRLGLNETPRFEVVYNLYSLRKNHRLRVKVRVEEKNPAVPSLTGMWPIADWLEREVWDMFGIKFEGHPNLKRILMYEEFQGHPLRKDYPYNKRQPLIGPKH